MARRLSLLETIRAEGRARFDEAQRALAAGTSSMSEDLRRRGGQLASAVDAAGGNLGRNLAQSQALDRQLILMAARKAPKLPSSSFQTKPLQKGGQVAAVGAGPQFNAPLAGLKALQSALYLGQDDKIIAALQTLQSPDSKGRFFERFGSNLERQEALSADLQNRFPVSSTAGATVGLTASLGTGAPAAAARAVAPIYLSALKNGKSLGEIPRLTATPKQHFMGSMAGGALNSSAQAFSDAITRNPTTPADLAGAFVGGALGARATIAGGPTLGSALEGFTTSATQNILGGEQVSLPNAIFSASNAALFGTLGDTIGTRWMERLPPVPKGKVGDALSIGKRLADWDTPNFREVNIVLSNRRRSRLDPASSSKKFIESKAGVRPKISNNQLQARIDHPGRYQIDWWHDSDAGKILGGLTGIAGSHIPINGGHGYAPRNTRLSPPTHTTSQR